MAEGWNSAWTGGSQIHANIWTVVRQLQKEESIAHTKWREQLTSVSQTIEPADEGGSRRIHQKKHMQRITNVCQQFNNIVDPVHYFDLLRSVL